MSKVFEWIGNADAASVKVHKVLQGWTAKSESRPVLTGVRYADGYAIATDSHRLLKLKTAYTGDAATVDKTNELIEGNFPDTSRLFPDAWDAIAGMTIQTSDKQLIAALKAIIAITSDRNSTVIVKVSMDSVRVQSAEPFENLVLEYIGRNEIRMDTFKNFQTFEVGLNAKYLLDAIQDFKKLGHKTITMRYYDRYKPLLFESNNTDELETKAIILPIRIS